MNIIGIIILVFIALLLVGIVFKLAKFALRLVSLVILFVFIIWLGIFIYENSLETPLDRLYLIEYNDSIKGYALGGGNYTFMNLTDDKTLTTLSEFDKVYIVSYATLKTECLSNTSIIRCIKNVSLSDIWAQVDMS